MTDGRIHSVETFGSVDGPGVRFVVFMQGCRMRCRYCHNPDTWRLDAGEIRSPADVFAQAIRYRSYWGEEGGITVSGGEPLLQMPFVTELFALAKQEGVSTVLDTSAAVFTRDEPFFGGFEKLMAVTDLVMLDLKHIDDAAHKKLTGFSNRQILDCASYLSNAGKRMWIRHVLVPELTDDDDALQKLRAFVDTLKTVERVEVLPFHNFAQFKWKELGIKYTLKDKPSPAEERVENARRILRAWKDA